MTRHVVSTSFSCLNVSFFFDTFSVNVSVAVLQVWPLSVADNLGYAHSNGKFSVAVAMYPYVLVRESDLEQSFKSFSNILFVY